MKKLVVINADDFGLSSGTNRGIIQAFRKGILTSASIMPTGPAYDEAVQQVHRLPKLGVGIHLSLTLGQSILPQSKIPYLVDNENYFYSNSIFLLFKTYFVPGILEQIESEFRAQIKKVLKSGIEVDHLDSQYHVHFMPRIFPIITTLAKKYKIPFVRVPLEPFIFHALPNGILKSLLMQIFGLTLKHQHKLPRQYPVFRGILYTRRMNKAILTKTLASSGLGTTEILSHPGYFDLGQNQFDFNRQGILPFLKSPSRMIELQSLTSRLLKETIRKHDLRLVSFRKAQEIPNSKLK